MALTHWKKLQNPDYLGAYALEPNQEIVLTIKVVKREMITGTDGKKEECTIVYFAENVKPMILNATNSKIIQKIYDTPYIEQWAGKKVQIYATKVKAFGEMTEALRIRPFVPKETNKSEPIICTDCKKTVEAFNNMTPAQIAQHSKKAYGKILCYACATKAKEAKETKETNNKKLAEDKPEEAKTE